MTFYISAPLFVYGLIQTACFCFPSAFWDGLGGKILTYWWGQHAMQRLVGPTSFHFFSLFLHELPVVILLIFSGLKPFWTERNHRFFCVGMLILFLGMVPTAIDLNWQQAPFIGVVAKFFRVKTTTDLFIYSFCAICGLPGTWIRWANGERLGAFLNYWAFAALAVFSFVGEKVPWLTVHVAFPAILVVCWDMGFSFERCLNGRKVWAWSAAGVFIFLALFQIRLAWLTSVQRAGAPEEFFNQVHNTEMPRSVVARMSREVIEAGKIPKQIGVVVVGEPAWSSYFYLIQAGFTKEAWETAQVKGDEHYIITDRSHEPEILKKFPGKKWQRMEYDLNSWFVPENAEMTKVDWLKYYLGRQLPKDNNGVGGARFVFLVRSDDPLAATVE